MKYVKLFNGKTWLWEDKTEFFKLRLISKMKNEYVLSNRISNILLFFIFNYYYHLLLLYWVMGVICKGNQGQIINIFALILSPQLYIFLNIEQRLLDLDRKWFHMLNHITLTLLIKLFCCLSNYYSRHIKLHFILFYLWHFTFWENLRILMKNINLWTTTHVTWFWNRI